MNSIKPNDEGFTGLEAAIVLIAFVVVAAVFSYVVLGAGFFTTQKSQETVHSAVGQASSTMELSGPVIAHCGASGVDSVKFYLQLASGGTNVDLSKIVFTTSTSAAQETHVWTGVTHEYMKTAIVADGILAKGDMVFVTVPITSSVTIGNNAQFGIDIQPDKGAALTVTRTSPAACTDGADHEVY
jgi:archaeal flagellin FlaB